MGGESFIATRSVVSSLGAAPSRATTAINISENQCEKLLYSTDNFDDSDLLQGNYDGGSMVQGESASILIVGDKIYKIDGPASGGLNNFPNYGQGMSAPLTDPLNFTAEFGDFEINSITSDANDRLWEANGYLASDPVPQPSTALGDYVVRPLDDPSNVSARLITIPYSSLSKSVPYNSKVVGTYYRLRCISSFWHPADGNYYHYWEWVQHVSGSVSLPRVRDMRIMKVTPGGSESTVHTITTPPTTRSLGSVYRGIVPTRDGGVWMGVVDPSYHGTSYSSDEYLSHYYLRRYDISDWSYQDFTSVTFPYINSTFDLIRSFWPTPNEIDSVTLQRKASYSDFQDTQRLETINSTGKKYMSEQLCESDNPWGVIWSNSQDKMALFAPSRYASDSQYFLKLWDLTGTCS